MKKNISDFNLNNITKSDNFLFPNKLKFLDSELSISFQNIKEYIISKNINVEISNKKGAYEIGNFSAENIIFFEKNKQKSLEFIKPFMSVKNNIFEGYTKEVKIFSNENKEINKILYKLNITYDDLEFSDAKFKYYLGDKFITNASILYKGTDIPVKMTGSFTKDFLINASLDFNFTALSLTKDLLESNLPNNFNFKNIDEILLEGAVSIEIFNSKLLAGSFEVKSDNVDSFLLKYNDLNYQINNFLINANIIEEQVEIEKFLISNANDKIEIDGIIENSFKDVNAILNINITKLDISSFSNLIYNNTENFLSNSYKISNIESGQLENTKFRLLYNKKL